MPEEIFIKILNNSATETEKETFYKSLEENSELRELYYQYKNLYVASNCKDTNYIELQEESFKRFWNRVMPVKKYRLVEFWYYYAAVFVIALFMGGLMQHLISPSKPNASFTQQIEYTSEKGSVSTIHLEDGSKIWLSSGSKISIHKNSTGEMSAQLKGEAYFDMIPDSTRKFTIDMGYFKVKDIGTKFDIRAYGDEPVIYAALVDGQIDLYKNGNGDKPIYSMKPGQYMQFNKQANRIAVSKQDSSIATAWKDGKFVFIDKTLTEICHELENWYNVQIIIKNKSLANTRYTSVIKRTTTVNLVLKMLKLTDNINYKITDRKEARDIVYIY